MTELRFPSSAEIRARELRAQAMKSLFVTARISLGHLFAGFGRHAHNLKAGLLTGSF
jgi:hypothetical protein